MSGRAAPDGAPPGVAAEPCHIEATEAEIAHLAGRDAALARLMEAVGPLRRERLPDPFMALVHAIAGQQISGAAHASVWRRLLGAFPDFTPETLAAATPEDLRACGLSLRKAGHIREIARRALCGELDLAGLAALDDAALCAALCELPGVGRWTAEMLMIFSLGRRDVLSLGDFGIRKGLRMLYGKRELTPAFLARVRKRYSPCASAASLYLWALAGGAGGADYCDPARPQKKKAAGGRTAKKGAAAPQRRMRREEQE
ncbi:MAG: DNA-3-methyladenine glycosylase 2 family protein [Desulfovibrio sp.]|nr:DNA-3-methyladenine glycosylase 2 family protein [Desulfovibrio sp.]